jgi:hypothetical protein
MLVLLFVLAASPAALEAPYDSDHEEKMKRPVRPAG